MSSFTTTVDGINLHFTTKTATTVSITSSDSLPSSFTIPSTVTDSETEYTVTEIGDGVFQDMHTLETITFPSTLTKIGLYAFRNCNNLTSLDLSYTNVTIIETYSFQGCTNLSSVSFPSTLQYIGWSTFQNTHLTSVTFPSSTQDISPGAFQNNPYLTSVDFSNLSITNIKQSCFYQCNLSSVTLPSSIETIESNAFSTNTNLTSLVLSANLKTIQSGAFYQCKIGSVTFPSTLETIQANAFNGNQLTSLVIPASVTSIGDTAFANNSFSPTSSILFEGNVPTGSSAMFYRQDLKIKVKDASTGWSSTFQGNVVVVIDRIYHSDQHLLFTNLDNIVTVIGYDTSYGTVPSTLIIPETLTINSGATSFVPANIGANAFQNKNITGLVVSSAVTTIESSAFTGNNLETVLFKTSNAVTDPSGNIFDASLSVIYVVMNNDGSCSWPSTFENIPVVPTFVSDQDFLVSLDSSYGTIMTMYPGATPPSILHILTPQVIKDTSFNFPLSTIASNAFQGKNIHGLTLPSGLKFIGSDAFSYNQISNLVIPSSVLNIKSDAFNNMNSQLKTILFEGNKPDIENNAFDTSGLANNQIQVLDGATGWSIPGSLLGATLVISNVCFPADTPVETDQGSIFIQNIDPSKHTIRKKAIVAVIPTLSIDPFLVHFEKGCLGKNLPTQDTIMSQNHCLLIKGKMVPAIAYIRAGVPGVNKVKYTGQVLYNVLMEEHDKMIVNGLVTETLEPNNYVAKMHRDITMNQSLTEEEKAQYFEAMNKRIVKEVSGKSHSKPVKK